MTPTEDPQQEMLDRFRIRPQELAVTVVPQSQHYELTQREDGAPLVNGVEVGKPGRTVRIVKMMQLKLAPANDTLYPNFDRDNPTHNPGFLSYAQHIQDMVEGPADESGHRPYSPEEVALRKRLLPDLRVLPTDEMVRDGDVLLPVFWVYHSVPDYAVYEYLRYEEAPVFIESRTPAEIMIWGFDREHHTYAMSILDRVDVEARLDSLGYTQADIGRWVGKDSALGRPVDQTIVSRDCMVSRSGPGLRHLVGTRELGISHARLIAAATQGKPNGREDADRLAKWAVAYGKTVDDLEKWLPRLYPLYGKPTARMVEHENGGVEVIPAAEDGPVISLVSDRRKSTPVPVPDYPTVTRLDPAVISREANRAAKRFDVFVGDDKQVRVHKESLAFVVEKLGNMIQHDPMLIEVEALATVLLQVVRAATATHDLLDSTGHIAAIPANSEVIDP